jgi:nitric oxide reductase subunit B
MIAGFAVLSYVTYRTRTDAPPIPVRVEDASGLALFTSADVLRGQEVFLKYGLMEHGTLWGHGAYLGPDYSALPCTRRSRSCRSRSSRSTRGISSA